MKTTRAYQTIPFEMGLNKDPLKNRVRFYPCYYSPYDARKEHPSKLILKFRDFSRGAPMYVPMTVRQIQKCFVLVKYDDIYSRFDSADDALTYMNEVEK